MQVGSNAMPKVASGAAQKNGRGAFDLKGDNRLSRVAKPGTKKEGGKQANGGGSLASSAGEDLRDRLIHALAASTHGSHTDLFCVPLPSPLTSFLP